MIYFHNTVNLYMKLFKVETSNEELEKLADKVFTEVEHTLHPTQDDIKKMSVLHIKRPHGTCEIDASNKIKEEKDVKNISGKWTKKDVTILEANWKRFCQKYEVDNPFWFLKLKKCVIKINSKNMKRFRQHLSRGLQNRSLGSVYTKWASVFCFPKVHKFSENELSLAYKLISRCKEEDVNDVLVLALQRPRKAILKKLKNPDNCEKEGSTLMKWTMDLEEKLVKCIAEELEAKELKNIFQPMHDWQWQSIAKKLDLTRPQVYDHWQFHLHPALVIQEWLTREELHIKLIERLHELLMKGEVDDWKTVDWAALGQYAGGFSSLFIYRKIVTMRWNYCRSKEDRDSIHESMKILWEKALPNLKEREQSGRKSYLRRLVYDWATQSLSELHPAT